MVKDDKRNEIIRIFRKYARLGLARERVNPIQKYKIIDACLLSRRSKLDMLAVSDLLRLLEIAGEDEILRAIEEIYFATAKQRISKKEISERVRRLAFECFCDERTIYRRLERAREMYEKIRAREGLFWD